MWKLCFGMLALLILVPMAQAQEEKAKEPPTLTPAQQYSQLYQEYTKAQQEYRNEIGSAEDQAAKDELKEALDTKIADFAEKCRLFAEANPKNRYGSAATQLIFRYGGSTPAAAKVAETFMAIAQENPKDATALNNLATVAATPLPIAEKATSVLLEIAADKENSAVVSPLTTLLTNRGVKKELADKIKQVIFENFINDEQLGTVCLRLSRGANSQGLLREIMEQTTNDSVKGYATFSLATSLLGYPVKATPEAEELLEKVIADYSEIGDGRLAKMATGPLFEIRNLQIGMTAPNIKGSDVDDEEFQLADYKGKVVVLDFWGDW